MKSAINMISLGEIKVGMYVMSIGEKTYIKEYPDENGEIARKMFCPNFNPWFKGIPFKVLGVAGPIIAIQTRSENGLPNVSFFDTRLVEIAEVPKKYYKMYFEVAAPKQPKKQFNVSVTNSELANTLR